MMLLGLTAAAMALLIEGKVASPIRLSVADIAAMPHVPAPLVSHGVLSRCEGVPLPALLAKAGVPSGEGLRGQTLSLAVVAIASDGYAVPFTLGEIDASLGNKSIVVADKCDGKVLDAKTGPLRLVASGEKRPVRSLRQLERLLVIDLPRGAPASGPRKH